MNKKVLMLLLAVLGMMTVISHASCDELKLPAELKEIQAEAFMGNTKLDTVILPEGIESIGERAFANSSIRKIYLPASLSNIAENAFSNCANVIGYGLAGTVANAYFDRKDLAFDPLEIWDASPIDDFSFITLSNTTCGITGYSGAASTITIPKYDGEGRIVVRIRNTAFYQQTGLKTVNIPNTVKVIDSFAFYGCSNLENVRLSNALTAIGVCAFSNCEKLTAIDLPNNVTRIENQAFYASGLETITIPKNAILGNGVFEGCEHLIAIQVNPGNVSYSSINGVLFNKNKDSLLAYPNGKTDITYQIPETVHCIAYRAFAGSKNILTMIIPATVTSIEKGAFNSCTALTSIQLSPNITILNDSLFYNCNLEEIEIPEKVTSIGDGVFSFCSNLQKAIIPESVENIADNAFTLCPKLTIYGKPGSCAETFANAHNIPFESTGGAHNPTPSLSPTPTPMPIPSAPTITSIFPSFTSLTINWSLVENADGYKLYYAADSKIRPETPAMVLSNNTNTATLTGLETDTAYSIWVSAYNASGEAVSSRSTGFTDEMTVTMGNNSVPVNADEERLCMFVAPSTDTYIFTTTGSNDTVGTLYDSSRNKLIEDDESGVSSNFRIEYSLTSGQIVYVGVRYYSTALSGMEILNISRNGQEPEEITVAIGNNSIVIAVGEETICKFVAPSADTYVFTTTGSRDTVGTLYDASKNKIAEDDDSGADENFQIEYALTSGQTVYIGVKYYSSSASGTETLKIYQKTEPVKLPAPTGVKVDATTHSAASVSFNAVSGAAGYYLFYSTSSSFSEYNSKVEADSSDRVGYVSGLSSGTTYYFWVAAYDSNGTIGNASSRVSTITGSVALTVKVDGSTVTNKKIIDWPIDTPLSVVCSNNNGNGKYLVKSFVMSSEPSFSNNDINKLVTGVAYNGTGFYYGSASGNDEYSQSTMSALSFNFAGCSEGQYVKVWIAAEDKNYTANGYIDGIQFAFRLKGSSIDGPRIEDCYLTAYQVKAGGMVCIKLKTNNVCSFYAQVDDSGLAGTRDVFDGVNGIENRMASIYLKVPASMSAGKHTVTVVCTDSYIQDDPNAKRLTRTIEFTVKKSLGIELAWPVSCKIITSPFGERYISGGSTDHKGIDIGASAGSSIYAAADGTVVLSQWYGGYGYYVEISHANGVNTFYGHMMYASALRVGDTVKKGDLVGYVGNTGGDYGYHLHFGVKQNNIDVDPLSGYIDAAGMEGLQYQAVWFYKY